MVFFKVGNTDYTDFTDIQNCDLNAQDVFEEWTDGNWNIHRAITRQRITGSVKLGFKTAADLGSFLSGIEAARNASGYYPVTAYVNNLNGEQTFNAFLDLDGEAKWDTINGRQWLVQTVTVTGR